MKIQSVLLSSAKSLRSFTFTMISILTPFYLLSLNVSTIDIGLIIVISVVISTTFVYVFSYIRLALKTRLYIMSALFSVAFLVLFFYQSIFGFILAIIIGGVSLAGRDLTPNQSIEQFTISHYETEQKSKNMAFSLYNFSSYGSGAIAAATLFLYGAHNFREFFAIGLILSLLQFVPYLIVKFPEAIERKASRKFDDKNKKTVSLLSGLFAMDSFGGGLVTTSMITLWFEAVYHITLSTAGLMFIVVNVVTAVSIILASLIAGRLGLVRTMVYTHLISNFFLLIIPVYHSLIFSQVMLYLRQTTSQMDVPTRDSFTNTIIDKEHRVRSNSVFLTVRNGLQIPGPGIGAVLIDAFAPSLFYFAGSIKIAYDLLFYVSYKDFKD